MKNKNISFYKTILGRKSHLIFRQDIKYFVFTSKDHETRGRFYIHPFSEIRKIQRQLLNKNIPKVFHVADIYTKLKGIIGSEDILRSNSSFIISRLRSICYILCANGVLKIVKKDRKIYFRK